MTLLRSFKELAQNRTASAPVSGVATTAEKSSHLEGGPTGRALVDALQSCPYPEFDIEPSRSKETSL
jgi:hypothetical protein